MQNKFDSEITEMFLIMSMGAELPVDKMELMDTLLYLTAIKQFTDTIKPLIGKYVVPEKIKELDGQKD